MVINPSDNQRKFKDKRGNPRVDMDQSGFLHWSELSKTDSVIEPVHFKVNNISLNGVGFTVFEDEPFRIGSEATAYIALGFSLQCKVEIIRVEPIVQGYYYVP